MGVGDWIPAGGKGHALLEVTGNVGNAKGGRMFGRRRKFSRFGARRNTKFASYRTRSANKWWFTYIGENGDTETTIDWSAAGLSENKAQVVISIEGHNVAGSQDNPRGSNEQVMRWIGRDGFISLMYVDPELTDGTPSDPEVLASPYMSVLYAWFKFKQDFAQSQPNNIATEFNMQASSGNLALMLQRKDIMRWGVVDVMRPSDRTETVSSGVFSYANQGANRVRSFIPFPRFPKAGFRVEPNDIIMCIVQPCHPVTFNTLQANDFHGMELRCMPMFRMLMAE